MFWHGPGTEQPIASDESRVSHRGVTYETLFSRIVLALIALIVLVRQNLEVGFF